MDLQLVLTALRTYSVEGKSSCSSETYRDELVLPVLLLRLMELTCKKKKINRDFNLDVFLIPHLIIHPF